MFRLMNVFLRPAATIFMLHRVCKIANGEYIFKKNMYTPVDLLESVIKFCRSKGYAFVSLDEFCVNIRNNISDRMVLFTFDDGYVDNFEYAFPVFEKHKVPFAIYVTTSLVERVGIPWWIVLEELIINNKKINIADTTYDCSDSLNKTRSFFIIRKLILGINSKDRDLVIRNMFVKHNIDWSEYCSKNFLNWQQLLEMSKSSLCTIGCHTVRHYPFNKLSEGEIADELMICKKNIEKEICCSVKHFAFPYGSRREISRREVSIVEKYNFNTSVTAIEGNIYSYHSQAMQFLPRMLLNQDFKFKTIS